MAEVYAQISDCIRQRVGEKWTVKTNRISIVENLFGVVELIGNLGGKNLQIWSVG